MNELLPMVEMEGEVSGEPSRSNAELPEGAVPRSDRDVRYSWLSTWLGRTLVAETDSGICAVLIGEDEAELEADLAARFRGFQLTPQEEASSLAMLVADRIDRVGEESGAVPLSLHGTDFQQLVWSGLLGIPAGETTSYAKLAERIGRPGSVRAVARACGANPVAVLVPCHRVLRGDGGISGYRWGVERKLALLQREQSRCGIAGA